MNLSSRLVKHSSQTGESKPHILNLVQQEDRASLSYLFSWHAINDVRDDYEEQLREYFAVCNPSHVFLPSFENEFQIYLQKLTKKKALWEQGRCVYYPWISTLVHVLEDNAFQKVRMARNHNLITEEEQKKFYNSVIGIAGLSVGNSVVLSIVLQGGGKHIRLADFDSLALSNLNRIRGGVDGLGIKKTEITARQIYLLNPYTILELFPEGLTKDNIAVFMKNGSKKLDVVIDEVDNMAIKCLIREYASRLGIPLVMAADNGDNAVVDIERYDKNPKLKFFHGRIGNVSYDKLIGLKKMEIGRLIAKHIGAENTAMRMQESLQEVGKTLVSWPQLGGAALLNGCAAAYAVRRILTNQPLESNRAFVSLDESLDSTYFLAPQENHRKKTTEHYKKVFGL